MERQAVAYDVCPAMPSREQNPQWRAFWRRARGYASRSGQYGRRGDEKPMAKIKEGCVERQIVAHDVCSSKPSCGQAAR